MMREGGAVSQSFNHNQLFLTRPPVLIDVLTDYVYDDDDDDCNAMTMTMATMEMRIGNDNDDNL